MIWGLWKQFPELRPFEDVDDLTDAQFLWVNMQTMLDRGVEWCPQCDTFGGYRYCGGCGGRYGDQMRECSGCRSLVSSDYCVVCGHHVYSDFVRRYEKGELDWTPFVVKATTIVTKLCENLTGLRDDIVRELRPDSEPDAPVTGLDAIMAALRAKQ